MTRQCQLGERLKALDAAEVCDGSPADLAAALSRLLTGSDRWEHLRQRGPLIARE